MKSDQTFTGKPQPCVLLHFCASDFRARSRLHPPPWGVSLGAALRHTAGGIAAQTVAATAITRGCSQLISSSHLSLLVLERMWLWPTTSIRCWEGSSCSHGQHCWWATEGSRLRLCLICCISVAVAWFFVRAVSIRTLTWCTLNGAWRWRENLLRADRNFSKTKVNVLHGACNTGLVFLEVVDSGQVADWFLQRKMHLFKIDLLSGKCKNPSVKSL